MPKFVPVTDSEKPKSEQAFYANELLEHRQFDNPHAVIRSAEEVADEEVDEMAQYLKHAEGANKMVKNEKGLWVKAKTVENEPAKNEKKGMGRGGGISVVDKLLQDHKIKQTDRDIPAESSRQFEDPKEEKDEKPKRRSPSSSEERTPRDKKKDNRTRDDSRERRRVNDRRRDSSRERKTGRKDRSRSRSPHYKRERSRDRDRRRSSSRRRDHRDRNDRDERKGERDKRSRSRDRDRDRDRRKHKDDYDSEDDRRDQRRKRSRTPEEKKRRKQKYDSDSSDPEKNRKESTSSRKKETTRSYSSDEETKKVSKEPPQLMSEKKEEKTTEIPKEKKVSPLSPEPEAPVDIPPMTAIQILNHFHEIFALKSSNRRMDQLMELFHPTCQIKNMKTGTVHLNGKDAIRAAFQKTNPHEVLVSKRIYFEHPSFVSGGNNERDNSSLVTYACDFHRQGTSPGLGDISKDTLLFYECADNQILTVWGMNDSEHLSQQANLAEDTIYFGSKVWPLLEGVLKEKWGKEISEKKINLMEVSHYHNYDQMEVWG
jgi:hypothetical protein